MNLSWRDALSSLLAILGAVVVFAKAQAYSWWLIGSWKGAVATLGVIGLVMLLVNTTDLLEVSSWQSWAESVLWAGAAALVIIGLFTASQAMFYSAAIVLGVTWLATIARHMWGTTHRHHPSMPYVAT